MIHRDTNFYSVKTAFLTRKFIYSTFKKKLQKDAALDKNYCHLKLAFFI